MKKVLLTDFGAKGDGTFDNTQAFAKAFEELGLCRASGA